MATETLQPNSDVTNFNARYPASGGYYDKIDEGNPGNGDTDYVSMLGLEGSQSGEVGFEDWSLGAKTINSVSLRWSVKRGGTTNTNVTPVLKLSGSSTNGTTRSSTSSWGTYTEELARPGGGDWDYTDFDDLTLFIACALGKGLSALVTFAELVIDYDDIATSAGGSDSTIRRRTIRDGTIR